MPNHCNNHGAIIVRNDPSFLIGEDDYKCPMISFQKIHPIPQELLDTMHGWCGKIEEQCELVKRNKENKEKYGYTDWYEFAINEWGTNRDVYDGTVDVEDNNDGTFTVNFSFDTAWSPPVGIYNCLSKHPDVISIEAYYWEPGAGFYGLYLFEDGEISDEEYNNIGTWIDSISAYVFEDGPEDSDIYEKASGKYWYTLESVLNNYRDDEDVINELKEYFDIYDEDPTDDPSRIQEEDFRKHH